MHEQHSLRTNRSAHRQRHIEEMVDMHDLLVLPNIGDKLVDDTRRLRPNKAIVVLHNSAQELAAQKGQSKR